MSEDRRGHTESLPPDVSQPGDSPAGRGVEPVVGAGREVDDQLVELSSSPHHLSGPLRLTEEPLQAVVGPLHLTHLQLRGPRVTTEGDPAISGTDYPRLEVQHSQTRLKSPPRAGPVTSPPSSLSLSLTNN